MNPPKITILLDHGYHPRILMQALKEYPQSMTKIRFQLSPNANAKLKLCFIRLLLRRLSTA
jgi:hypothetical protein